MTENILNKEKIIVALDVETAAEAREIIAELRGEVGAFKIGLQLFTATGASFVREIIADGNKIFLDVKFHDIPNTVSKAAVEAARLGVWMFNIHAIGGSEMLQKTVSSVREVCMRENLDQPKIIAVTILTSFNRESLREVGLAAEINTQVLSLARLSAKCGLDGVVASPMEAAAIRQTIEKKDFLIVTPGIRNPMSNNRNSGSVKSIQNSENEDRFGTIDDQKRVMTPAAAIGAGADYLVIGRPIVQAENKISAVRSILREIETI